MKNETKIEHASSDNDSIIARSHAWLLNRAWWQLILIFLGTLALASFDTVVIDWIPFIDEAFLYAAVLFVGRAVLEKAAK